MFLWSEKHIKYIFIYCYLDKKNIYQKRCEYGFMIYHTNTCSAVIAQPFLFGDLLRLWLDEVTMKAEFFSTVSRHTAFQHAKHFSSVVARLLYIRRIFSLLLLRRTLLPLEGSLWRLVKAVLCMFEQSERRRRCIWDRGGLPRNDLLCKPSNRICANNGQCCDHLSVSCNASRCTCGALYIWGPIASHQHFTSNLLPHCGWNLYASLLQIKANESTWGKYYCPLLILLIFASKYLGLRFGQIVRSMASAAFIIQMVRI